MDVFIIHPSLRTVNLYWNVVILWKAIEQSDKPQSLKFSEVSLMCLIWRLELETQFRPMSEAGTAALCLIERGRNFGHLCDALVDDVLVGSEAAKYLEWWIEDGLFVSYAHPHES